jgi:LmbE family N-acetylglucosaminyl deacetylase
MIGGGQAWSPPYDAEGLRSLSSLGVGEGMIHEPEVSSNSRIIVLAPHHLDEIFGCGGTICKLAKRGAHVKVVHLTGSSYSGRIGINCRLVPTIHEEAKESLAELRCFESECLDLTCHKMAEDSTGVERLYQIIEYNSPDLVFIPSLQERHPDSLMTGLMAALALRKYDASLTLYSYGVWGGFIPNTLVEITDVMEHKVAALSTRRSQGSFQEAERMIREANAFGLTKSLEVRYGETYLRQKREDFLSAAGLAVFGKE